MRGIYLTTAANDRDLVRGFKLAHPGVSLPLPIRHGDFMWDTSPGWSPKGERIQFCGDRKKIPDLLQCIDSGRHVNQVRSAYAAGISRQCLIVEGSILEGPNNTVRQRKGAHPTKTTYSRLKAYLHELHHMMGVQVIHTKNLKETITEIYNLWCLFQEPPEDHGSLRKFYTAPMASVTMMPGLIRRVAKELNYIGWDRSLEVEKRFGTVQEMVNASKDDWLGIDGMGEVIAHSAVRELQG